jgi:hypothetical protein
LGNSEQAASEMMMNAAVLAEELSDGLKELNKYKINVDKMPLKRSKAQKH